ncbi:MAG: M12 family metallopeptidase [Bdellovibrio sp.]
MKPMALGVLIGLGLIIVQLGNGCAPSFKTFEDPSGRANISSCSSDESSLSSLDQQSARVGYLDQRQVSYHDLGDGWIQIEGDMLYSVKGGRLPNRPLPATVAQGVGVGASDRWPNGRIPYVINPSLTNQARVSDAVAHWNYKLTGVITLVPRTNESDYVEFKPSTSGCAAPVGYFAGQGIHGVHVADACGSGNVAHEIGHVVGLDHEQNRHDRNTYVQILNAKVIPEYRPNFNISSWSQDYIGYDFGSIMHYGLSAFSIDGSNTIVPKVSVPSNVTIGQRSALSVSDVNTVRAIYGASPVTPTPGTGTGLFGRYYNGIDFANVVREIEDPTINFSWPESPIAGVNADNFSVRWDGWLRPTSSGAYNLVVDGQDGYRVRVNGATVISNLNSVGYSQLISGALTLTANQSYPIIVEFVGKTGLASMKLSWRRDGGSQAVIPADQMVPNLTPFLSSNCN